MKILIFSNALTKNFWLLETSKNKLLMCLPWSFSNAIVLRGKLANQTLSLALGCRGTAFGLCTYRTTSSLRSLAPMCFTNKLNPTTSLSTHSSHRYVLICCRWAFSKTVVITYLSVNLQWQSFIISCLRSIFRLLCQATLGESSSKWTMIDL